MSFRIIVKTPDALKPGAPAPGLQSVEGGLVEMGQILEREIKTRTPLGATKILRGSIFSEPRGNPVREVIVGSTSLYAPIVERGRQPGKFPPPGPIQLWVRRILGVENPKEIRAIAFLVARKIARFGTEGAFMFERASKESNPALQAIAEKMGKVIVNEAVSGK
jgi:hypothetical protein